jgi:hypothetical protein
MSITATAKDGTIRTVSDVVPNRFWTLTEVTAAIALANAVLAGTGLADTGLADTGLADTGLADTVLADTVLANTALADSGPGAASGFELVATYGDFDADTSLDAPTAWRMILILQAAGTR